MKYFQIGMVNGIFVVESRQFSQNLLNIVCTVCFLSTFARIKTTGVIPQSDRFLQFFMNISVNTGRTLFKFGVNHNGFKF